MKQIFKHRIADMANVYIRNGHLIKYRWYSDDPSDPDFILGTVTQIKTCPIYSLPEHCLKRIEEIEDRKVIESDNGISFYGFSDEDLDYMLHLF